MDLIKTSDGGENSVLSHKLKPPTICDYNQLDVLMLVRSPGVGGRGGGVGGRPRRLSRASIFSCGNLSRLRGSRWRSLLWTRSSRSDCRDPGRHRRYVYFLNDMMMNPINFILKGRRNFCVPSCCGLGSLVEWMIIKA